MKACNVVSESGLYQRYVFHVYARNTYAWIMCDSLAEVKKSVRWIRKKYPNKYISVHRSLYTCDVDEQMKKRAAAKLCGVLKSV